MARKLRRPRKKPKRPTGPRERQRNQRRADIQRIAEEHATRDKGRLIHATVAKLKSDIQNLAPKKYQAERIKFYGTFNNRPLQQQIGA